MFHIRQGKFSLNEDNEVIAAVMAVTETIGTFSFFNA
jgi:hypothetical protein